MTIEQKTKINTIPFTGGCNTYLEPTLLASGKYSMVQNMRQTYPGLKKRPGQSALHTVADGTNRVMSLYQFTKGRKTERHLYGQFSDGDVLEATNNPPTTTTGAFGAEVHNGTVSGIIPASWSNIDDTLFYSNGSDQHQIYFGNTSPVRKFIVYKGSAAIPDIPIIGEDYTDEVTDGVSTTVAVLDSLGDLDVDYDCVFICTPVVAKQFDFTVTAANANCATAAMKYRKNDNTWASVSSFADGTDNPAYAAAFSDDMSAATNWTGSSATPSSVASGQAGNCLQVAETGGANPGDAYHDITTVAGQKYFLKYYFKKGTADNGKVGVGTSGDEFGIYDSGNLSDANWTLHETEFTASGTTTRITLRSNDATAGETSLFDTLSIVTGTTLAATGAFTWTAPTDSMPSYMFGTYGYWYQWYLTAGTLDGEVEVSAVTFESSWQDITNMWDGVLIDAAEAQVYDQSAATYLTYGSTSITLNSFVGGSDYLYVAFADPVDAFYVDVGDTPNTTASTTIDAISYWNGTAWASVGTYTDASSGCATSAYIVIPRRTTEQKLNFNKTQYYAYWYKISLDKTLSSSVNIGIQGIPRFDISDFGKGVCNAIWKERALYTFTLYPEYIYVASSQDPQCLNGGDFAILQAGDGRSNRIRCLRRFYNELMVFQEEKGEEGGCITMFEGYSPETFGKIVLSAKYGTMNSQSVAIVDGFRIGEGETGSAAFILSKYGILISNGRYVKHVPGFDAIKNYFDQTDSTDCIRSGYEDHMWLKYDSAYHILRIGLVTGSSASTCNTFLVYDLTDQTFSIDSLGQELSCMTEVEAASGAIPILQIGGGVDDGLVYRLNTGTNDVSTAIDSYVMVEVDGQGEKILLDEVSVRMKVQSSGTITITPYRNSVAQTAFATKSMVAETTNEDMRRHRFNANVSGYHIGLKFQHNTASQSCHLLDYGVSIKSLGQQ